MSHLTGASYLTEVHSIEEAKRVPQRIQCYLVHDAQ